MSLQTFLFKSFLKSSIVLGNIAKRIAPPDIGPQKPVTVHRSAVWFQDNGDSTLRLDYPLTTESVVVDLGGYEGQWAADIYIKYSCRILIFEPYKVYAENIRKRFSNNANVSVYEFGLSDTDKKLSLGILDNSSSTFKAGAQSVEISLKPATDFFISEAIDYIDLIKINIEGGEYDVLDHLIATGFIKKMVTFRCNFMISFLALKSE